MYEFLANRLRNYEKSLEEEDEAWTSAIENNIANILNAQIHTPSKGVFKITQAGHLILQFKDGKFTKGRHFNAFAQKHAR